MRKRTVKNMSRKFAVATMTLVLLVSMTACGSERKAAEESGQFTGNESGQTIVDESGKDGGNESGQGTGDENGKDTDIEAGQGAGGNTVKAIDNKDYKDVTLPEDGVILISYRTNYAEGNYESGSFVDSKGDVYSFDFSSYYYYGARPDEMSLLEKLDVVRKHDEPVSKIGEDMVKVIYGLGSQIDKDAGFEEESEMCDYGQDSIYFVPEGSDEPLLVYSYGDNTKIPKDEKAQELNNYVSAEVYDAIKLNKTRESVTKFNFRDIVFITDLHSSGGNYQFIESKCNESERGIYMAVTDNKQTLRDFVKNLGFGEEQLDEFFGEIHDAFQDDLLYFIELDVASQLGPDINTCGVMLKDGHYTLLPSPGNPKRGEVGCDALDYYCHIVGYPMYGEKLADLAKDGMFAEYWKVI